MTENNAHQGDGAGTAAEAAPAPETEALELTRDEQAGLEEEEERRKRRWLLLLLLLLLLLCCFSFYFIKYIRQPAPLPDLVAPDADVNYQPHYLFSIYGMDTPVGVTLSPDGQQIYVSESGGERLIRVFDRDGDPLFTFTPPLTSPGERSPVYMATDSSGRVYVADRLEHVIFVYEADGTLLDAILDPDLTLSEYIEQHMGAAPAGSTISFNLFSQSIVVESADGSSVTLPAPQALGWSPLGVRINSLDQVFITDLVKEDNRIRAFDLPEGDDLLAWHDANGGALEFGDSGQGNGEFLFPNAAMSDSQGRIFVSDGNNGRISVWSADGDFLYAFGRGTGDGALNLPRGIWIDSRDRLFVVDAVGQDVKVYDISGEEPVFLYAFGNFGMDDGLFNYPNDIVLDGTGRLYIVDRENHRVQVWSY